MHHFEPQCFSFTALKFDPETWNVFLRLFFYFIIYFFFFFALSACVELLGSEHLFIFYFFYKSCID